MKRKTNERLDHLRPGLGLHHHREADQREPERPGLGRGVHAGEDVVHPHDADPGDEAEEAAGEHQRRRRSSHSSESPVVRSM